MACLALGAMTTVLLLAPAGKAFDTTEYNHQIELNNQRNEQEFRLQQMRNEMQRQQNQLRMQMEQDRHY